MTEFIKDEKGNVQKAKLVSLTPKKDEENGRISMVPVEGSEKIIDAQLVLIAAGFIGAQKYVADAFKAALDDRTNVKTGGDGDYQTSTPGCLRPETCAADSHWSYGLYMRAGKWRRQWMYR